MLTRQGTSVEIIDGKAVIGTFAIAKGFDRQHFKIRELIDKYAEDFEYLSDKSTSSKKRSPLEKKPKRSDLKKHFALPERKKRLNSKTRVVEEYLLNEAQMIFLGTLFRNTPVVVRFKRTLAKEFDSRTKQRIANKAQQLSIEWKEERIDGKIFRAEVTDQIELFKILAKNQGSKNYKKYYIHFTNLVQNSLFETADTYPSLRDVLSMRQLSTLGTVEQILARSLKKYMAENMPYKDIYKKVKKDVKLFVDLYGKIEVPTKEITTC